MVGRRKFPYPICGPLDTVSQVLKSDLSSIALEHEGIDVVQVE